ncbi:hypothetical protein [Cupriavidus sp.]|uniref:hypothetical protein n=1 Tax=Cupriavidus sp. TaxID=1873897 RepID=UPI0031D546E0
MGQPGQNPLSAEEMQRRQYARKTLDDWWLRLERMGTTWDLETIKHVVVINAAGFAGVSTLLAGTAQLPKLIGGIALAAYGLGVILAVLNMYLASQSFFRMNMEISERIGLLYKPETDVSTLYAFPKRGRWLRRAGSTCGWIAALLAMGATAAVGWTLVADQAIG